MRDGKRIRSRIITTSPIIIILIGPGIYGLVTPFAWRRTAAAPSTTTKYQWWCRCSQTLDTPNEQQYYHNDDKNENSVLVSRRHRQIRKKAVDRKPRYYWLDRMNLHREFVDFWSNLGVSTNDTSPTIPNESLLMHYERHDLRAAIVKNGGRHAVSILLNHAPIMPGRWKDAISTCIEVQQLIHRNDTVLSPDRPPWHIKTAADISSVTVLPVVDTNNTKLWSHHEGRNQKGHWNLQIVVQELYEYVDRYKQEHNRPSVWMPRPSELAMKGRDDLRQAMNRYGGVRNICRMAGMISYQEWFYFEGQLELLNGLKQYLDEYANGDYTTFPTVSDVKRNGYDQLHHLIQYYGGRKFLSSRLNMSLHNSKDKATTTRRKFKYIRNNNIDDDTMIQFGLFDLMFAIQLLNFVRSDQLKRSPPLQSPVIAMPSRNKLLRDAANGEWLDAKIDEFGGYENVARRLGLALFATGS